MARLLNIGVQVISAPPSSGISEFWFPAWKAARVDPRMIDRWRPGWMLAARTGIAFDVIDIDPRNGGDVTLAGLHAGVPPIGGRVATPGGGEHLYVPAYGGQSVKFGGIDYQAADALIYLPGTSRPKYGGRGYRWQESLDWEVLAEANDGAFPRAMRAGAPPRHDPPDRVCSARWQASAGARGTSYGRATLVAEADAVAATRVGARNVRLNLAAFRCGQLVAAGQLNDWFVTQMLMDAADECGLIRDNGHGSCHATINSGLRGGTAVPRQVAG